jgi:hypothetical protein
MNNLKLRGEDLLPKNFGIPSMLLIKFKDEKLDDEVLNQKHEWLEHLQ